MTKIPPPDYHIFLYCSTLCALCWNKCGRARERDEQQVMYSVHAFLKSLYTVSNFTVYKASLLVRVFHLQLHVKFHGLLPAAVPVHKCIFSMCVCAPSHVCMCVGA